MHPEFILPIALVLTVLAGCFAGLFWRLASRYDARNYSAEWLGEFSLESYAPMERLLDKSDLVFLAAQPGYRPELGKRLMAERRKIFAGYLARLVRDFNQLVGIGKLMVVHSQRDSEEFARHLLKQQIQFYLSVFLVRTQLVLHPLGWAVADTRRLVAGVNAMREQIIALATPAGGGLETA